MFWEKKRAIFFVKKKEIIPEIRMIMRISIRVLVDKKPRISFKATAAPVRVFDIV